MECVACQASLSLGFSRQEYWSELPFPSPGDLPDTDQTCSSCFGRWILYHLSHLGSIFFWGRSIFYSDCTNLCFHQQRMPTTFISAELYTSLILLPDFQLPLPQPRPWLPSSPTGVPQAVAAAPALPRAGFQLPCRPLTLLYLPGKTLNLVKPWQRLFS